MSFKEFEVSDNAVADAKAAGIGGDAKARLKRMAKRSAPITHDYGNRRFQEFVLNIVNDEIVSVKRAFFPVI